MTDRVTHTIFICVIIIFKIILLHAYISGTDKQKMLLPTVDGTTFFADQLSYSTKTLLTSGYHNTVLKTLLWFVLSNARAHILRYNYFGLPYELLSEPLE